MKQLPKTKQLGKKNTASLSHGSDLVRKINFGHNHLFCDHHHSDSPSSKDDHKESLQPGSASTLRGNVRVLFEASGGRGVSCCYFLPGHQALPSNT